MLARTKLLTFTLSFVIIFSLSVTFLSANGYFVNRQLRKYSDDLKDEVERREAELEMLKAEEWITDKYALRNEKKLNRITGKFRRKTIDFADALFQSAAQAFGQSDKQVQPTPKAEATPAPAPANTTVNESKHNDKPNVSQASPEGFTAMDVESIPSTSFRHALSWMP